MSNEENSKIDVIVIDDEITICKVIQRYLESVDKYNVSYATEVKDGFSLIKNIQPDIVLLDIHMPDISGMEFLKMIKEDKFCCHIPIIMVTGDDSDDAKEEASYSYADGYITKPFSKDQLDKRIQHVLANRIK